MEKIIAVVMGQNCERFIGMALESAKDADAIVYCDGGSTDGTFNILDKFSMDNLLSYFLYNNETRKLITEKELTERKIIVIQNKYDQEDKGMNGKQRNFYLNFIKEYYPDWWCLAIDADEVLSQDGIRKIKEFLEEQNNGEKTI